MSRNWRRPVLCLTTDRRRLAQALAQPQAEALRLLSQQINGAIRGGVDAVQIRERDLDGRVLARVVRDAMASAKGTRSMVIINDRVDVAIAEMTSGVHLREDSMSVRTARLLLAGDQLVGRSVHDAAGAIAAQDADYLIAGNVFHTTSKPEASHTLGLDGLQDIVRRVGSCPVWAIGGITPERATSIAQTGAAGVVAISMFIPEGGHAVNLENTVQELTANLRFSFDTAWRRS
jgi:thiamine-phosphate pyrophosphorylase